MEQLSLTVIFITLNEEFHIGEDIAQEVFVVDSLSTDRTVDIALAKGAKVVQRPFKNFGDQWNFALEKLPIRTEWTMKMDPDERVSDELKKELYENLSNPESNVGYSASLEVYFLGKPIKCRSYHFLRIWKTGACHFSPVIVNEHPIVNGDVKKLRSKLMHLDSRDMHAWLEKQNRYTSQEALTRYLNTERAAKPRFWGNSLERRVWLSNLFWHVPFRYQIYFFLNFIVKGAWKSGIDGWRWAVMRTFVTRMVEYKWKEMENNSRELTIPKNKVDRVYDARILASELQKNVCGEPDALYAVR